MGTAGSIVIDLLMRTGAFETDSKRAEKRLKELGAAAKQAGAVIGTAIVSGATLATVAIKSSIDAMDEMSKAAQRVGASTEAFSALAYAGGLADVSIEDLSTTLGKLTRSQAAALNGTSKQAKVFELLGISVKDAAGNLREADDVLGDFADAFQKNQGSPEVMAAGFDIFGKSFQKIIPLLKDGKQGLEDATAEAKLFGQVISSETGQKAEAFNDDLYKMTALAKGLANQVAADLLPDMQSLTAEFVGSATEGNKLAETARDIANAIRFAGDLVGSFVDTVQGTTYALIGLANGFIAVNKASRLDFSGASKSLRDARTAFEMADDEQKQIDDRLNGVRKPPVVRFSDEGRIPESMLKPGRAPALDYGSVDRPAARSRAASTSREMPNFAKDAADELQKLLAIEKDARDAFEAFAAQLAGPLADAAYQYSIEQQRLNDLAKTGAIDAATLAKAQADLTKEYEANTASIQDRLNPHRAVNEAILEEIHLLGMSAAQQEIYNNLKAAGVTENDAFGKSIIENTERLQEMRESYGFVNDTIDGFGDAMASFADRTKTAKEAFGDWADDLYSTAIKWLSDQAMNYLKDWLKQSGNAGSGTGDTGGGWLGGLIGAFSNSGGSDAGSLADLFSGEWGFADGGYTGAGGKKQAAGIVHAGEYVINAEVTRELGLGFLDKLNRGWIGEKEAERMSSHKIEFKSTLRQFLPPIITRVPCHP